MLACKLHGDVEKTNLKKIKNFVIIKLYCEQSIIHYYI